MRREIWACSGRIIFNITTERLLYLERWTRGQEVVQSFSDDSSNTGGTSEKEHCIQHEQEEKSGPSP